MDTFVEMNLTFGIVSTKARSSSWLCKEKWKPYS